MILRTRDVKFLHQGSAENVLYHVGMDDCADPMLGVEHYNDSYTGKCGEVPTPWKCGKGPTTCKHRKLCLSVVEYRAL